MMVRQHVSHESSDLMSKKINIIKSYVNYMKKSLIMIENYDIIISVNSWR